jgi:hypothetical protein
VIGTIPVVGNVVENIVGVQLKVKGTMENPEIRTNKVKK